MVQYDVKRVSKGTENFMVSFDFTKTPITQVADYIIIAASTHKASDIHFDPREDGMMVRFRIDGDCQDYTYIPKAYEKNLTTRLKLLANMNITETRLPQDGAIKGQFGDTYLDMRVACLPTNQGEKIVIRILDYTRSLQGIDSLGFHPKNLEKIHHMMGVPNGIILVTGATGSGKSTTTYSMLSALNKPEVNVITVEDPVEMNIEGINQVQVNADIGMTFAAALRSILREDPNVILIGEIRDSETAQIAVRASITGHLVMSTLHTNNALATVERLLDMDVERYLLSTALTGIISQRLAKQLCPDCRHQRETTKYEKKVFKNFLHKDVPMIWDANPKGCENCRKGYRGRLAFHEVLLLDERIRTALNDETMKKDDFAKMIYSGSTISMLQDALIKALDGQTSFEEVYRTIEIENEDTDNYEEEINGITGNEVEEEQPVETTTDEMFDEDMQTSSTPLTQAIEIPGVTTGQQSEQPEQVEIPNFETQPAQQPQTQLQTEQVEIPNFEAQPEQTEVLIETPPTESQPNVEVPITSPQPEENVGYKIVMPDETNQEENILPQPQEELPIETLNPVAEQEENKDALPQPIEEEREYDTSFYSDEEPLTPEIEIKNNLESTQQIEKLDLEKEIIVEEHLDETPEPEVSEHLDENVEAQPEEILNEPSEEYPGIIINENAVEAPILNIQAISVIPSVPEEVQELHTASEVLTDPGIRIAEPQIPNIPIGTISKPVEINAEPILPTI